MVGRLACCSTLTVYETTQKILGILSAGAHMGGRENVVEWE